MQVLYKLTSMSYSKRYPVVKVPLDTRERSSSTSNYWDPAFPHLRFHIKTLWAPPVRGPKADVEFPRLWFSTLTTEDIASAINIKHTSTTHLLLVNLFASANTGLSTSKFIKSSWRQEVAVKHVKTKKQRCLPEPKTHAALYCDSSALSSTPLRSCNRPCTRPVCHVVSYTCSFVDFRWYQLILTCATGARKKLAKVFAA